MNSDLQDRLRGIAVGAAVGDALGMPLEFGPRSPDDALVRKMQAGRLPAGSFTDDTEMALALADSLLEHNPLDPADLAQRFVAWMKADPPDIGIHTRHVLGRIKWGDPWDEAVEAIQNARPDSAGNGSLMRCWPVAIVHWDDLDNLLVDSWTQSRVTHPHRDCVAACAYTNVAIYHMLRGKDPSSALLEATLVVRIDEEFMNVIRGASFWDRHSLQNSGWVRHTMQSAVWALLNFDSFEEAVVQAVNLGNDADSTGAVVGAMAGAYYGLSAIPERWRSQLRGEWPLGSGKIWSADDLIQLVDQLVATWASSEHEAAS